MGHPPRPHSHTVAVLPVNFPFGEHAFLGMHPDIGAQLGLHASGAQNPSTGRGIESTSPPNRGPSRMSANGSSSTDPATIHLDMVHGHTSPWGPTATTSSPHWPHNASTPEGWSVARPTGRT